MILLFGIKKRTLRRRKKNVVDLEKNVREASSVSCNQWKCENSRLCDIMKNDSSA